jgi:hypothetical protein
VIRRAAFALPLALALAACGGGSPSSNSAATAGTVASHSSGAESHSASKTATTPAKPKPPPPPSYPHVLPVALSSQTTPFATAVSWRGQPAAWITRAPSGVAMLAFDQSLVELHLHSGSTDAGTLGWRFGPAIAGHELGRLVAAFNGGFRLSVGAGGFMSYGRVGAPLSDGLGSIVTYANGRTDIGAWHQGVPAPGQSVVSVRQNLTLLINQGAEAPNVDCLSCWGATLGGVTDPARSALGITADGRLIWAGGEHLTVSELAAALLSAGVVRAVELDINPEWVAAYLYGHRGGHGPLAAVPVMPGQQGIPGQYLAPWSRDFFTITAR